MSVKTCIQCHQAKPATTEFFYKDRSSLHSLCRLCFNANRRARYVANKEKERLQHKAYYEANKAELKPMYKAYVEANKDRTASYQMKYRQENRAKAREYFQVYMSERRSNDLEFKIKDRLRARINKVVKYGYKGATTVELLGCSVEHLKQHLESQFDERMTWENYGTYWHVDHIRPCASFNLEDVEQQKECFHFSNLQPLEAIENIRKGAKWKSS